MNESARPIRLCTNCGTELKGPYCFRCGQATRSFIKAFPALVSEVAGDTLGYDARMWRTIRALLMAPGFLSYEYVFGRRVRYTPPFRLYLIVSLVTFLMVGLLIEGLNLGTTNYVGRSASATAEEAEVVAYTGYGWLDRRIDRIEQNMEIVQSDPGRYLRTVAALLPHMMFVLLPVFAMLISPFYLLARRYYIEHLVLLAHNHVFIFLSILITWPLIGIRATLLDASFVGSGLLAGLLFWTVVMLWLWVPVYLFIAMKRFYRQGWMMTMSKYMVLAIIYFHLFFFAAAGIALLGMLRV